MEKFSFATDCADYAGRLSSALAGQEWRPVSELTKELARVWRESRQAFVCGNGGSAANAIHWANDFIYPIAKAGGKGIRMMALPANSSTLTCLANDVGYDEVFSRQLATYGEAGDVLIVFSGSGNSPNILRVLETAKEMKIKSFAILGYSGGAALGLADVPIHFQVDDMQVAEDVQLIVGHMILQALVGARRAGTI